MSVVDFHPIIPSFDTEKRKGSGGISRDRVPSNWNSYSYLTPMVSCMVYFGPGIWHIDLLPYH